MNGALISGVLGLEGASLWLLLQQRTDLPAFALVLCTHALASLVAAALLQRLLPAHYRRPGVSTLLLAWGLWFFVPVIGGLALLLAVRLAGWFPKRFHFEPIVALQTLEFLSSGPETDRAIGQSGLRYLLTMPGVPADRRMRALLALSEMPGRVAGPMLRLCLADQSDDVRLMAYGMLDAREKAITARLTVLRQAIAGTDLARVSPVNLRLIAELNWELVFEGLVQGDLRLHTLREARLHAESAIAQLPSEGGLHLLLGRVLIAQDEFELARGALQRAIALGMPQVRVAPFLAEIAFEQKDYPLVRKTLAEIGGNLVAPTLRPLASFWTHP